MHRLFRFRKVKIHNLKQSLLNISSDTEEPSLNCRDETSETDLGSSSSSSVTIMPNATDNVGDIVSVTCTHTSNDTFPFGETNVTCRAIDAAGNIGSCSFVVAAIGMKKLGFF